MIGASWHDTTCCDNITICKLLIAFGAWLFVSHQVNLFSANSIFCFGWIGPWNRITKGSGQGQFGPWFAILCPSCQSDLPKQHFFRQRDPGQGVPHISMIQVRQSWQKNNRCETQMLFVAELGTKFPTFRETGYGRQSASYYPWRPGKLQVMIILVH